MGIEQNESRVVVRCSWLKTSCNDLRASSYRSTNQGAFRLTELHKITQPIYDNDETNT